MTDPEAVKKQEIDFFDELHAETLPDYEEMFRIVDDESRGGEGDSKSRKGQR